MEAALGDRRPLPRTSGGVLAEKAHCAGVAARHRQGSQRVALRRSGLASLLTLPSRDTL